MSTYQQIRALESILYSESDVGFQDLDLLARALVAHYEWNINNEQIEWVVQGVLEHLTGCDNEALIDSIPF